MKYLVASCLTLFFVGTVGATPKVTNRALLISYAGTVQRDELALVDKLVRVMDARGLHFGKRLVAEVERMVSSDPGDMNGAEAFRVQVKKGRQQFIEGHYEKAVKLLEGASAALSAKAALLAQQQDLRAPLLEALLFLAHAHLRANRNREAAEVIGQAVRAFPDQTPSLAKFAPELVRLYKSVRLELRGQGRRTLEITTDVPGCLAFINGRYVGITPTKVRDLLPGRYRVYVQQPKHRGRVHLVDVPATTKLALSFTLDTALESKPQVVLRYGDEQAMKQHQVQHAVALGRALGLREVFVVGFSSFRDRRALSGSVISMSTGRVVRSALLALAPSLPNDAEISALANFLRSGDRRQGVLIQEVADAARGRASAGGGAFFNPRVWRWVTLGLGVVAVGVGTSLVAMDGDGTCSSGGTCKEVYETAGPGIGLIVGGGLALAGSAVLFLISPASNEKGEGVTGALRSSPRRKLSFTPWVWRRAAGLTGCWRF